MCIQDSRRSYRTYAYATEFNLFGGTRRYHRDYETYTGISEHILVLQNLYWSYRTYTGLTELILVYRTYSYLTEFRLVLRIREYSQVLPNLYLFTDTRVPIGTTGLILTLSIREYPQVLLNLIKYKSTRRYYRTKSETGVPLGTT